MNGEPVIPLEQLDLVIASRMEAEIPAVRQRADREHELIMASRSPVHAEPVCAGG